MDDFLPSTSAIPHQVKRPFHVQKLETSTILAQQKTSRWCHKQLPSYRFQFRVHQFFWRSTPPLEPYAASHFPDQRLHLNPGKLRQAGALVQTLRGHFSLLWASANWRQQFADSDVRGDCSVPLIEQGLVMQSSSLCFLNSIQKFLGTITIHHQQHIVQNGIIQLQKQSVQLVQAFCWNF